MQFPAGFLVFVDDVVKFATGSTRFDDLLESPPQHLVVLQVLLVFAFLPRNVLRHMAELGGNLGVLLLVLLAHPALVLVQVRQFVQAHRFQLFGVRFDLFGRVLQFLHEGPPGAGDVASLQIVGPVDLEALLRDGYQRCGVLFVALALLVQCTEKHV